MGRTTDAARTWCTAASTDAGEIIARLLAAAVICRKSESRIRAPEYPEVFVVGVVVSPLASLQATVRPLDLGKVLLSLLVGGLELALQLIGQAVLTVGAKLGDKS
jgi:hypothetical protein